MRKSKNMLLLSLAFVFVCMVLIPWGCKNDWPLWLFFVAIAELGAGICISWWGTDYGVSPVPLEKMPGRDKALHICSFVSMTVGFYFIAGLFGKDWWLVLIGCAIVTACSFVQRYLAQKYGKR